MESFSLHCNRQSCALTNILSLKRFIFLQGVARNSLFLFFASVLQKYHLKSPLGPEKVNTDPIVGFIHYCPSYNVEISVRPTVENQMLYEE